MLNPPAGPVTVNGDNLTQTAIHRRHKHVSPHGIQTCDSQHRVQHPNTLYLSYSCVYR